MVRRDRLRVGEVALFNPSRGRLLSVRLGSLILLHVNAIVAVVEHVLHVLRVVLRSVMMMVELLVLLLLLVRQFNGTGSVKELGGSVGAHVLKLNPIDPSSARSAAASSR